ncbi:Hsp33 family molecular chaperone HslO [Secundilactobacillus oryzae]|uniref:Hsp33 family molecular chaperone HslO n=1 Tax=Secundilactobacillus oryzae TaxID=1202668 RepID=UPI0020924CB6|nr:Hsp33 family molecular chaperone HslO [Secundilactobacillus oryzae]
MLDKQPVAFKCDCSKDRFAKALSSVNPAQLQEIIDEDHHAETVCRFCGKKYDFSEAELKQLLEESK